MVKSYLLIRLQEQGRAQWVHCDREGHLLDAIQEGMLTELVLGPEDKHVFALVPSEFVTLHTLDLPALNRKQQLKAIPFALEEQLPDDIGSYFFLSLEQKTENGRVSVAVIKHEYMKTWLDQLKAVNISPQLLIPELLALEYIPNTWQIYIEGQFALVRTELTQGFVTDIPNLELLINNQKNPKKIILTDQGQDASVKSASFNFSFEKNLNPQSLLAQAARTLLKKPVLNLLQEQYYVKPLKEIGDSWYSSWSTSWYLGVLLIIVLILGKAAQAIYLSHVVTLQQKTITQIFYQHFPASIALENPQKQMEQQLKVAKFSTEGGKFLSDMDKVGSVISQYKMLTFQSITFNNSQMTFTLPLLNLQWQQEIINQLSEKGLKLSDHYESQVLTFTVDQ
jgi:general secretion pathway protein L